MEWLWPVPFLPLLGVLVHRLLALAERPSRTAALTLGVGIPVLSFAAAVLSLRGYLQGIHPAPHELVLYRWAAGGLAIEPGLLFDSLSSALALLATFLGVSVALRAAGSVEDPRALHRLFSLLHLSLGALLLVILGRGLVTTLAGWQGLGLASSLLLGLGAPGAPSARRTFLASRIGGVALLLATALLLSRFGTDSYRELVTRAPEMLPQSVGWGLGLLPFVTLCLLLAAASQSGLLPFPPGASSSGEPNGAVRAWIHSAPGVLAGTFLVLRCHAFFDLTPRIALAMAGLGLTTALFAAAVALAQTDVSVAVEWATLPTVGLAFVATGIGAHATAVLVVGAHALARALLLLTAGSLSTALGGATRLQGLGGLASRSPFLSRVFLLGVLTVVGAPGLAGFFSNTALLATAREAGPLWWGATIVALILASLALFRLYWTLFGGSFRGGESGLAPSTVHLSATAVLPLLLLAVASVLSGWTGKIPFFETDLLGQLVGPTSPLGDSGRLQELLVVGSSWIAAGVAALLAWRVYGEDFGLEGGRAWAERYPRLHRFLASGGGGDRVASTLIGRPLRALSRFSWKGLDAFLLEGGLFTFVFVIELGGELARRSAAGRLRTLALAFFGAILVLFLAIFV